MDASERLSLESTSQYTVLASEHIHRYEFAAAMLGDGLRVLDLACGTGYGTAILARRADLVVGVDSDVATVDVASAACGDADRVSFEVGDALDYLDGNLAHRFDAIVCFEGLEHFQDLKRAVGGLRRQAERGVRLIISVPNSKAFEEDNEFHVTNFGYEQANALLAELPGATMVGQHLTEGSLILPPGAGELDVTLVNQEQAEPEYANHFLLAANVDREHVLSAARGRTLLVEGPVHNRYMRNLEVANAQLRRRNNELARKLLHGRPDSTPRAGSAAPSFMAKMSAQIEELTARASELSAINEGQLGDIVFRDEMILAQRSELLQLRQDLLARNYRPSLVNRVRRRLQRSLPRR